MTRITADNAAKQEFMPLMRELVRAYQAFAAFDAAGYRGKDLTVPQADVLFTLGNTTGLTFTEIGASTLITKGTLTGVIDRLEDKGLVKRAPSPSDGRCTLVRLTAKGRQLFDREFPRQIGRIKERFDRLNRAEREQGVRLLRRIREAFD